MGADFLDAVVHKTVEVFPDRTVVMELRPGAVQLALAGGYGNDLYRRVKSLALLCSSGLINLAERTFSDLLDNFPIPAIRKPAAASPYHTPPLSCSILHFAACLQRFTPSLFFVFSL